MTNSGSVTRAYWIDDNNVPTQIDTGYVIKNSIDLNSLTISIGSKRELINVPIDMGAITAVNYPTAPSDSLNKQIPLMYGAIEKYEPIPIANDGTTVTYIFCAATQSDTTFGVQRCPRDVSDIWTVASDGTVNSLLSQCSISYSTGTFTIPQSYAMDGTSYNTIYISFFGWHRAVYDNIMGYFLTGIEIMCDMLDVICAYRRTAYNYNMEAVNNEIQKQLRAGRKLSFKIDDNTTKVFDVFGNICRDTDTQFLELGDGRFSPKVDYESGDTVLTIVPQQIINGSKVSYTTDMSNVITSIIITYGAAGNSDTRPTYTDTSRETTISQKYKILNQQTVDSLLYDLPSAQDKVKVTLDKAQTPLITATFQIPLCQRSCRIEGGDNGLFSRI